MRQSKEHTAGGQTPYLHPFLASSLDSFPAPGMEKPHGHI